MANHLWSGACPYQYQLCTSDSSCSANFRCNIPISNYETCIPLNARFDEHCRITTRCAGCVADCMGSGYGYCVPITEEPTAQPTNNPTLSPTTPAPTTPSPLTPAPTTPSPTTPAPANPNPVIPAPITPSPILANPGTGLFPADPVIVPINQNPMFMNQPCETGGCSGEMLSILFLFLTKMVQHVQIYINSTNSKEMFIIVSVFLNI